MKNEKIPSLSESLKLSKILTISLKTVIIRISIVFGRIFRIDHRSTRPKPEVLVKKMLISIFQKIFRTRNRRDRGENDRVNFVDRPGR